jgi:hypothetical protein
MKQESGPVQTASIGAKRRRRDVQIGMPRSANAQLAVDLYEELQSHYQWTAETAWHGIARLLLSCEVYRLRWEPFLNVVTYVDSNRFTSGESGPHATLRRAEQLTTYLATQLRIDRPELCQNIGLYWQNPKIRQAQPHNLAGHAFRSLITTALAKFGDHGVEYEEEVDPRAEFPGHPFTTRSKNARIDIVARRGDRTVALLAVRWRVRHNRLGVVADSLAYKPTLYEHNPDGRFYAVLGEFDGGRLRKVLANCSPIIPHAAISAAVHFAPELIREGLQENGTLEHLRSLGWLISETFQWK